MVDCKATIEESGSEKGKGKKELKEFTVPNGAGKDLKFHGERLAFASSRPVFGDTGSLEEWELGVLKGVTQRWHELSLYKTKGGKHICHRAGFSVRPGELPRHEVLIIERQSADKSGTPNPVQVREKVVEAVSQFFGYEWLAKLLLEKAEMNDAAIVH